VFYGEITTITNFPALANINRYNRSGIFLWTFMEVEGAM